MNQIRAIHESLVRFAGSSGALAVEIGSAVLVLALVIFCIRWQFSEDSKRRRLVYGRFKTLAKAHKLKKPDRILLLEMSRQIGLDEPSMLFVRKLLFETGARKVTASADHVDALRQELFS